MADLVTVQDFKDAEGLTGAKDDDRLNILVPQISELVKRYCGTSFVDYYSTDKTEVVNITENTSVIIVSESPLVSVTSVKERTGQIGIQKSLGAKNYFILLQFIFESIVLSLFGGLVGLIMVFVMIEVVSKIAEFDFYLSFLNIFLGIGLSVLIGILSGAIPAYRASRMDPVEAIRANG